jgi:flagellar biosynthesis protein FliQ
MYTSQLSIIVRGIIFVLMVLLPFFSTWILEKIVAFIHDVYNWLPKNMHKQLQNKN